ncbi:DUF3978 family protein [Bacillus sp. 123MFChir2]|uniref:DUF3978 family protein n=1 Tax=Bacillus sp. 123MFChir2 TaxID=1169144 RepID=UPI00036202F9|nr:DUF3978 family protein [Bacillus sp. 123MFChir2]
MELQIQSVIQEHIHEFTDQTIIQLQLEELDPFTDTKLKTTTLSITINKEILQFRITVQSGIQNNMYCKTYAVPVKAFHYILASTQEDSEQVNANMQVFGHQGEFLLHEKLSLHHVNSIRATYSEFTEFFVTLNEKVTKYINQYRQSL